MFTHSTSRRSEHGFTLTELLIVIVVMGILAGVVVFAMSGVTNHAKSSACSTEKQTIDTAEDAYYANPTNKSQYGTVAQLKSGGYLKATPASYTVTLGAGNTSYTIAAIAGNANACK
jgi:prepilin-type N-terminal cleavage/methylation domain-containing protein